MKGIFLKLSLINAIIAFCCNPVLGFKSEATPASALFVLDKGVENLKADYIEDYFFASKVTWGSDLIPDGMGDGSDPDRFYAGQDNKGYKQLWFTPDSFAPSSNDSNTIKFTIQPRFGLTFKPDKVSLKTTRYSTDGGRLDISWINPDGSQVTLAEGVLPCRDSSSPAILEWSAEIDTSKIKVEPGACGLVINLHSLDKGKHVGISNVSFEGTISGEEKEIPQLKSLIANGQTYNAEEIFEPEGDTYTTTIELFSSQPMISATNPVTAVTVASGNIGELSYAGNHNSCEVTIPMSLKEESINYVAKFIRKPIYTITYINTDGSSMGSQQVEKDTPIGQFDIDFSEAIVKDGYKARGWFLAPILGTKAKTTDLVTRDMNLYALQTEEEVASPSRKYSFDLTSETFYPEDHEAFILDQGIGYFLDKNRGWAFQNGDSIKLLVGPKATIAITYSPDVPVTTFDYEGEPGIFTLTLNMDGGETYLQNITIYNNAEPSYTKEGNWYFVKPGDVWSFLDALEAANESNAMPDAPRAYIFLPDGIYDMGEKVLTKITGNNISLIGQSMDDTRIVNAPNVKNEGIGTTATLLNESNGLYIQDMTLQNALDYYKAGSAGRAVVLQDKGTNTICKNVAMLSYQDTYYSNNPDGLFYFDGSKVAGTVDFFCGGGTMFMENSIIQVEKRNINGKGECTLTAPATSPGKPYGYVFSNCTIMNNAEKYNLGRAWQKEPRCAFINTKVNDNKMSPGRWTAGGMNTVAKEFVEFNTTDPEGNVVSPSSKVIEFTKDLNKNKMETILTPEQAKEFEIEKVFPEWQPRVFAKQIPPPVASYDSKMISWSPVEGAVGYAIFCNGNLLTITDKLFYSLENSPSPLNYDSSSPEEFINSIKNDNSRDVYTIRSVNSMGGFGEATTIMAEG